MVHGSETSYSKQRDKKMVDETGRNNLLAGQEKEREKMRSGQTERGAEAGRCVAGQQVL